MVLSRPPIRDHPRGCGGTRSAGRRTPGDQGPSPRVRGNLLEAGGAAQSVGTIPAGAGEPQSSLSQGIILGDHPRGCGGTGKRPAGTTGPSGPSPRVRGNLLPPQEDDGAPGTIPAGAGEPELVGRPYPLFKDHPRGCGGTSALNGRGVPGRGPSPRVRGNRPEAAAPGRERRTIPAGAGEPTERQPERARRWDHPRGCGGTRSGANSAARMWGPSPRVRGNRQ